MRALTLDEREEATKRKMTSNQLTMNRTTHMNDPINRPSWTSVYIIYLYIVRFHSTMRSAL